MFPSPFLLSLSCCPLFSIGLCLSVCLSEKRKMMTSPINSVAPPPSAVAPPLGNQGGPRANPLSPCPPLPEGWLYTPYIPPSTMAVSIFSFLFVFLNLIQKQQETNLWRVSCKKQHKRRKSWAPSWVNFQIKGLYVDRTRERQFRILVQNNKKISTVKRK